ASLYGADITPNSQFLYAQEGTANATQGIVRKVNLTTGAVSNLTYALAGGEAGGRGIAIDANGDAFFDSEFSGSGWVPLHKLDTATDTISDSGHPGVRQRTLITRGADGSRLFFEESNISSGPIFTYTAATGTFSASVNTGKFNDSDLAAISRDGSLIAMES